MRRDGGKVGVERMLTFASWSPYNYVLGNPILLTDPDGRARKEACCGGVLGLAWLAERQNPEKARGLTQGARNYEVASGGGTITGMLVFLGVGQAAAYPASTLEGARNLGMAMAEARLDAWSNPKSQANI